MATKRIANADSKQVRQAPEASSQLLTNFFGGQAEKQWCHVTEWYGKPSTGSVPRDQPGGGVLAYKKRKHKWEYLYAVYHTSGEKARCGAHNAGDTTEGLQTKRRLQRQARFVAGVGCIRGDGSGLSGKSLEGIVSHEHLDSCIRYACGTQLRQKHFRKVGERVRGAAVGLGRIVPSSVVA